MTWSTFAEWTLTVAKFAAMGMAFLLVWTLRNAFIAGWNIHRFISQFEAYRKETDKDIRELQERLDIAGREMSNFGTELQAFPERMRRDFMPRPEVELQFAENRTDRQLLRDEINNIWKRINEREERRRR